MLSCRWRSKCRRVKASAVMAARGDQEPHGVNLGVLVRRALSQPGPQQEEQGREKEPIPGVGKDVEGPFVHLGKEGDVGGETIIAVPQKAQQVQGPGGQEQALFRQDPPQDHQQQDPGDAGGEVPQVVEGPVKDQQPQDLGRGQPRIVPGVETQGEIEQNGEPIEEKDFPAVWPDFFVYRWGSKEGVAQHELARDQEEKGNGYPGQHPGEEEVSRWGEGGQGRGVDGHHQESRGQLEGVKAAVGACF